MQELSITPHVGVGPVSLGADRESVRAALRTAGFNLESSRGSLDYFADASIQVEYGADGTAEFIGVSQHRAYSLTYFGMNVFDTTAEEVFAAIAAREGAATPAFESSGYVFPEQIVTLWEADEQYDRLGGRQRVIWAQVGLGDHRYLQAIRVIKARRA